MYEYIILKMNEMNIQSLFNEITDQEILDTMTFNEFNLYPGIVVDSLDQIDNVLNDPTIKLDTKEQQIFHQVFPSESQLFQQEQHK